MCGWFHFRRIYKKTVILIDEYDVPLDKAFQHGYYKEMVFLIRAMFGKALKTNDALAFAVLTGCLRVSKESIFTGFNNFKILSITDTRFDEQFGFTDAEVQKLLSDYHLENRFRKVKEWYDGYRFGKADVYCPWDVINFVDRAKDDPEAKPEAYWINTSGNDLVKRFIDKAHKTTKNEIERLIAGEVIEKELRLDLTYEEIDQSIENLWSVLFTTGYLTQVGRTEEGAYRLVIPNREVREVFRLQINEWFKKSIFSNTERLNAFWKAVEAGDTEGIEQYLNRVLNNSISVFDTKARKEKKESSLSLIHIFQDSWMSVGWFKTVPGEETDPEGYSDGDERWYYAEKDGDVVKSRIKKINGYYYAFDEYGKMLEGLYKLEVSDKDILSYTEIESENDLPEDGDIEEVYYFGGNSKAGAMKTGTTTLDIDGERYTYNFRKSGDERGQGYNGIEDGAIYEKGKRLEADKDEKLKKVEWDGETYLVNTSGKIQKNKKNAKDADDRYYCTDSKGIVTYEGMEKKSEK